jgi:hypothetical protein
MLCHVNVMPAMPCRAAGGPAAWIWCAWTLNKGYVVELETFRPFTRFRRVHGCWLGCDLG